MQEVEGGLGWGVYGDAAAEESPTLLTVTPTNSLVDCWGLKVECLRHTPVFELGHQLEVLFWETVEHFRGGF